MNLLRGIIISESWVYAALLFVLFLLLLTFCTYCCYVKYIHMKYDHIPGPPRDSFLFGHIHSINKSMQGDKLSHDKLLEWAERYGPVYRLNTLHRVSIYVISPAAVQKYMMSAEYPKDPYVYNKFFDLFGVRFMGRGLITDPDHVHWYKQRKIMNPAFSHSYLKEVMGVFNEKAEHLMQKLDEIADGKTEVSMHAIVNSMTLDVITKVAFGMDLRLLDNKDSPFPHAVSTVLKGMMQHVQNQYMQYMPQHRKFVKEVQKYTQLLRHTGSECIKRRKEAVRNGEDIPKDILTQILKSAEQEGDFDDEIMLDNFVTFFIAGQETTANQICFTIRELTRQPEITAKLRAEVADVVGSKCDVSFDDVGKLQYLTQVLKESLRLYPPGPGTSRMLTHDDVIEGIRIPRGVPLIFSTYIMGRMDRFFKDPLTFDPERFSPEAPKPNYCYFPFTLGPRTCLGQAFAQLEAKVVLAKLLQRFNFELAPGQSFEIMDTGTLRPKGGVVCTLTPLATNKIIDS